MTIFSDITRADTSPSAHNEPTTTFLDRVAGPYWDQIRALIEGWFSRIPPADQADLRGRLRDRDERQFGGAFFELYLHEALLAMEYTVTCHPELPETTRRPDFLAEKDGQRIYIEARATSDSNIAVGSSARVNTVYESLDKLDSPNFFLWIDISEAGLIPLRTKPLRSKLEAWLKTLDPDKVQLDEHDLDNLPTYTHNADGWEIAFQAIPKSLKSRGRDGIRPLGVFSHGQPGIVDDEGPLRKALSVKGKAYGELDAPFVIAVGASSVSLDEYDILNALYGTDVIELVKIDDGLTETNPGRNPDGYWYRGDHWAHRGVSGVLVVKNLHYAFVGTQQHTLWAHPDPVREAPDLSMWARTKLQESGQLSRTQPEQTQAEWFGLPSEWPVGDPFPKS